MPISHSNDSQTDLIDAKKHSPCSALARRARAGGRQFRVLVLPPVQVSAVSAARAILLARGRAAVQSISARGLRGAGQRCLDRVASLHLRASKKALNLRDLEREPEASQLFKRVLVGSVTFFLIF